jgi:hypothetical protein
METQDNHWQILQKDLPCGEEITKILKQKLSMMSAPNRVV